MRYIRSRVITKKIMRLENCKIKKKKKKERDLKDLFPKIPVWSTYIIPLLNEDSIYIVQSILKY